MIRRLLYGVLGILLLGSGAQAESIHLSHFGEVMQGFPYAVAFKLKLFQKNGADITEAISSHGGGSTIRNMLAGGVGFGEVAAGATVTAIKAGLPVKIVGIDSDSVADVQWIVRKDSPLKSVKDLKGKKFGTTHPGALTWVLGQLLLRENGLSYKDVTPVPVGTGAGLAALDHGAIAATYEYQPLFARDEGKYRVLARVSDYIPRVVTLFQVATQNLIDKHPAKLRAIILARKQAVDYIYAHPKKAADLALSYMVGVDKAVLERSVEHLAKVKYWSEGGFNMNAMKELQKVLMLTGAVKKPVNFKKMIDQRFLPPGVPHFK